MWPNGPDQSLLRPVDIIHQEIITGALTVPNQTLATASGQLMHLHPEFHRIARADFLEAWKRDPIRACRANSRAGRQGWNQARLAQQHTDGGRAVMIVAGAVGDGRCRLIERPISYRIVGED